MSAARSSSIREADLVFVARLLDQLRRPGDSPPIRRAILTIALFSPLYGLAMGAFELSEPRAMGPIYSAVKMPLLIFATSAVCLPGYFALSTVLRLRDDLRTALRAIVSSQAAFAAALVSLSPITLFMYANGVDHRTALLTNGMMFFIATLAAQAILWRRYRPLLMRSRRHALMLSYWLVAYIFVGIQMGWMLRPFVGTPGFAPTFFREEPFSNAYVVVWRLVVGH
ncbi:MAG: hypothetical protein KF691_14650 [Phycisphaeraceae bacterium]|nr:hypothetical protein [Phycisphaeraceae bacterium]